MADTKEKPEAKKPGSGEAKGRLTGRTAVITGAAGSLGGVISRRFAEEGAFVVMAGRSPDRMNAARQKLIDDTGIPEFRVATAVFDGGSPDSIRAAFEEIRQKFGRVDILVNNAGSAGPKQPIENIPLTREEMEACGDSETLSDAIRSILGVTWNTARIAAPMMPVGASMINVSTIFSHARYYGRAAYVVPKAALNALSDQLALELGERGIRVNNIFPGPIESERIRTVFAAMDKLQGNKPGETAEYFLGRMTLKRGVPGKAGTDRRPRGDTLPTPLDIANACVFLGSEESAALNGIELDVTHGMKINKEDHSTFITRPTMRSFDGVGTNVLMLAGEKWEEALDMARVLLDSGARVLFGLTRRADVAQAQASVKAQGLDTFLTVERFNRSEPGKMEETLEAYSREHGPLASAIVLPVKEAGHYLGSLLDADDATADEFMDVELAGMIAVARTLSRYWKARTDLIRMPRVVFMSNPSDGARETYNDVLSAGIEQLIRIWRDESQTNVAKGLQELAVWGNQIIRYTNRDEEENARFAIGHATRILFKDQKVAEIDLRLPGSIAVGTGARRAMVGAAENISGLHQGKVAFITGASAGIGGQVARLLALAGGKVMMVARRKAELDAARERIIGELQDIGMAGVDRRVKSIANVDVNDFAALKQAFDATIEEFGRIDYLINNAGVAGAEKMVIDMGVEEWRATLNANLISNYFLTHQAVPLMKAQGNGYVLNVSSYFGGEKFLAVAYPNRADYAVSKAGQRAMVEAFSQYLGPEIQCNAVAPGPVDGDRLSGTGGKPGLFQRRARLILENKRLNAVYAAVIDAVRAGASVDKVLNRLSRNSTSTISHDHQAPEELRRLALECARQGDGVCTWDQYLLTRDQAAALMSRLRLGGYLAKSEHRDPPGGNRTDGEWLVAAPPEDRPFLPAGQLEKNAARIGEGVLSQLHLGTMPTEAEVAQAIVFFLADRAVSGETFMPSGGLRVERSTTEREMFGSPKAERLEKMRGKTVWVLGEHLSDYIAETLRRLILECGVGKVMLLTRTKKGARAILDGLGDCPADVIDQIVAGDDIESAMDEALARSGAPTTVVSMPCEPLPNRLFEPDDSLSPDDFAAVIDENLTRHFRVARKAALYDNCQLVLVTPDVPVGTEGPAFALANFVKTTLHAFTSTLAVESERLTHEAAVNQVNLTRRVRSEEPIDDDEHEEELRRFARAVLLVGAPLPDAQDSRYRARIYRGTSMTV